MAFVQIVLTFPFAAYKINDGLVYRLALLGTVPARCYFFCAKPACYRPCVRPARRIGWRFLCWQDSLPSLLKIAPGS